MILKIKLLAVVMAVTSCTSINKINSVTQNNNVSILYTENTEDFPNPERGFYLFTRTNASSYESLTLNQLNNWKKTVQAENGAYTINSTLIFRYFDLDAFINKPLSSSFINNLNTDFSIARQAGFKVIPRFAYTLKPIPGDCAERLFCPPYGDAPKDIVLQHIKQLKNVLEENADVIAVFQMGFIGIWGEQYYTDYFGDASINKPIQKLLDSNWQDRNDILKALLEAVPKERMIQVRYPQLKQRYVYGINATVHSAPLNENEAFSETDKARIGFHNDCFLASSNDYGTYEDYGNSSTPRAEANAEMRKYKKNDSKYVAVGGETCDDAYSPQNDCEPSGKAQTEMREFHYSFLNSAYNNDVNNDWLTGGCLDEIKKSLGYRFVLKESSFPKTLTPGQSLSFSFNIENKGYASPYNKRPLKLILRNRDNGKEFSLALNTDIRRWFPGSINVTERIILPADIMKGNYQVFLFLPDYYTSIASRPDYAIRLANINLWEEATGYNDLQAVLKIQ